MAFTPPRPMLNGKSGWHIFQAAVETRDMLRNKAPHNVLVHLLYRTDCTLTNSVVAKLVGMSYFTSWCMTRIARVSWLQRKI